MSESAVQATPVMENPCGEPVGNLLAGPVEDFPAGLLEPEWGLTGSEIHERAVRSHRHLEQARWVHLFYLRQVQIQGVHTMLGYSSMRHYGEMVFGYDEKKTQEYLRVAAALESLPKTDQAFRSGEIDWSKVREVTRVAVRETEEEWLELGRMLTSRELEREVAAVEQGSRPRRGRLGTPRTWIPIMTKLRPTEVGVVEKAVQKLRDEAGEKVDFRRLVTTLAMEYLQRDEKTEEPGPLRVPRPVYTVAIHKCPVCRNSLVETADGPEPISEQELQEAVCAAEVVKLEEEETSGGVAPKDAVAEADPSQSDAPVEASPQAQASPAAEATPQGSPPAEAIPPANGTQVLAAPTPHVGGSLQVEDLDDPTPPAMRRQVILRDYGHCQAPGCPGRGALHVHHVRPRCEGGETRPENLITLCLTHHSLAHDGLLVIAGEAPGGLTWKRRDGTGFHQGQPSPEEKLAYRSQGEPPRPAHLPRVSAPEEPFVIPDVVDVEWWNANKHRLRWNNKTGHYQVIS